MISCKFESLLGHIFKNALSFRKKATSDNKNLTKAVKNLLLSSYMLSVGRGQTRVGEIKSSYWFVSFHDSILRKNICLLLFDELKGQ